MANRTGTDQGESMSGDAGIVNDTLNGAGGNDNINGVAGDDKLIGGAGNDSLIGGDGNDFMFGDVPGKASPAGNDKLDGGFGNDEMQGGGGADTYNPGTGTDFMRDDGTSAGDLYTFGFLGGPDRILDEGGANDTVKFINVSKSSDVHFSRPNLPSGQPGNALVVTIGGAGSVDVLTIMTYFTSPIENFLLSDGTRLTVPSALGRPAGLRSVAQPLAGSAALLHNQAQAMVQQMAAFGSAASDAAPAAVSTAAGVPVLSVAAGL